MEEKKEVDKQMKEEELEKTAGGIEIERQMYQFRCSCGNIVRRGNDQVPKFPCPKCMKKEWECDGVISYVVHPESEMPE